ncbi:MAG: hypothetical protein AAFO94_19015, partial [Bacteroidota bacterium]
SNHCISIYIPTVIAGDYEKNRIRWKNAVAEARKQLEENNVSPPVIEKILRPAMALEDQADFWANQSAGLAGFYAEDFNESVAMAVAPPKLSLYNDRFLLHPMLPTLLNTQRLFILALSRNEVRFFEAHKNAIFPVKISDLVPADMESALMLDKDEKSLQFHTTGGGDANFHGHGAGNDDENIRTEQYFRKVDDGLQPIFRDERVPLVLAMLKEDQSIYREVSNYNHLADFSIDLQPENSDAVALHSEVLPYFDQLKKDNVDELMNELQAKEAQNLAGRGIDDALQAANYNNIDTLLVSTKHQHGDSNEWKMEKIIMQAYDGGATIYFTDEERVEKDQLLIIKRFELNTV